MNSIRQFICFACLLAGSVQAALGYEVRAVVTDSIGEPLPYVTYRIYKCEKSEPEVSNTTDDSGAFRQNLTSNGDYRLTLSYVGMNDMDTTFTIESSNVDLGKIIMHESQEMLGDVTVTAQRPLVVKEIDRIGYDVQADPESRTAMTDEILRKVPMVSVDADGTIKVNGSTNFKIYKNGRPNNSMSRNAKDLFKAMPASMIKRIEVITEPGAEYDAEGTTAILNIVTDENVAIKGVLGTANISYDSSSTYPNPNLWITTEIDKVTVSASGGYGHFDGERQRSRSSENITFKDGLSRQITSESENEGDLCWFNLEGSWQPDTMNLFTAEASGYHYNIHSWGNFTTSTFDANGNKIGGYNSVSNDPYYRYFDVDANFNYQHRTHHKGETLTLSYMLSHTNQGQKSQYDYFDSFGVNSLPYSAIHSRYKLDFFEHTVQGDWTRPFGNHKVSFGFKGIFRRNHSNNDDDYIGLTSTSNEFKHNTDIAGAYGQYSTKVGAFGFRAGLRYEYSHLKADYPDGSAQGFSANLSDLVPSAAVSWQVNDANSLNFNYATSISRPGISYLNPAVSESPTKVSFGNPDLSSSARHSLKLTYMLIRQKINLNFSAGYALSNNGVAQINYAEDGIIYSTYDNVGRTRNLSFSGYMQWSITPKTRFMLNGSITRSSAKQGEYKLARWTPQVYAQVRQELPWKIQSELYGFYWGNNINNVWGYYEQPFYSSIYWGISLSRGFLKENRLNVRLMLDNPIGNANGRQIYNVVNGDYTGTNTAIYHRDLTFRVAVSYRFGSLNTQVKKVNVEIENTDLKGRRK